MTRGGALCVPTLYFTDTEGPVESSCQGNLDLAGSGQSGKGHCHPLTLHICPSPARARSYSVSSFGPPVCYSVFSYCRNGRT